MPSRSAVCAVRLRRVVLHWVVVAHHVMGERHQVADRETLPHAHVRHPFRDFLAEVVFRLFEHEAHRVGEVVDGQKIALRQSVTGASLSWGSVPFASWAFHKSAGRA
jgi:hypothetical protein